MGCLCFRHSGVDEAHVTRGGRGTGKASSRKASASALANGIVLSEKAVGGFQRSGSDDSTKKRERHSRTDRLGGSHTLTTTNLHPRVRSMPRGVEGEQVAAGWPPWLASVAGEAIKGWIPRRADSFEKLNKVRLFAFPRYVLSDQCRRPFSLTKNKSLHLERSQSRIGMALYDDKLLDADWTGNVQ